MKFFLILPLFVLILSFKVKSQGTYRIVSVVADSVGHFVYYEEDEEGFAKFYFTNVEVAPCEDNVCFLIRLRLYWDASGNYLYYRLQPKFKLTKLQHVAFLEQEYYQLHKILNNPISGMKYMGQDELVTRSFVTRPDGVDGISEATSSSVNFEFVDGAIKTTYTLWNLVHSSLGISIKNMAMSYRTARMNTFRFDFSALNNREAFWNDFQRVSTKKKLAILQAFEQHAHKVPEEIIVGLVERLEDFEIVVFTAAIHTIKARGYFNRGIERKFKKIMRNDGRLKAQIVYNMLQQSQKQDLIKNIELNFRTDFP